MAPSTETLRQLLDATVRFVRIYEGTSQIRRSVIACAMLRDARTARGAKF